jgi:hypothetical protein
MTRTLGVTTLLALTVSVAACNAQCAVTSASLSEGAMAAAIDPQTKAPLAAVTSFAPDAAAIYATAKLSLAPPDTKIKATFHYLEGGDREIAQDEVTTDGTRYVQFTLSPPVNGWPAGQYEARLLLDGKEALRLPFNVTVRPEAAVPPPPSSPAPTPVAQTPPARPAPQAAPVVPSGFKPYHDDKFLFALAVPETWAYRVTPKKDYLIEGPKGTDAFEVSIILQFVYAQPDSTADAQLRKLEQELLKAPAAVIKTRGTVALAGADVPAFVATYNANDSAGTLQPFTHMQVAAVHGAYVYLISFSAPTPIYQKYLADFRRVLDTFMYTGGTR